MTYTFEPYSNACGVELAIKEAAQKAAKGDPSLNTNQRIQLEYFNRFLSRIFVEQGNSDWVLKGATGILARVPSARSTRDIDLHRQGVSLTHALTDLKRLATVDLGDHFYFEYVKHQTTVATEAQPYTDGCRVTFNIFLGVRSKGTLQIDLAGGREVTDQVITLSPATALILPRLPSNPYRLYSIVDQIADKVCATMADYGGYPSGREKDLVDLLIFARTQEIDGTALMIAIDTERRRRKMESWEGFTVPQHWGRGYAKLSQPVPCCADYPTVQHAIALVTQLIDPALHGESKGKTWSPDFLQWR